MPESPRGWLCWMAYVLESQARPFTPRYDGIPPADHRLRDSRETALSVKLMLERSANGNGGAHLLAAYYLDEMSWWSFTKREQRIIEKTARAFAKALREAGFIPQEG